MSTITTTNGQGTVTLFEVLRGDEIVSVESDRITADQHANAGAAVRERRYQPVEEPLVRPRRDEPFGTVIIPLHGTEFVPRSGKTLPQLLAERLPHDLARELAIRLNTEALEKGRGRWHFLVCSPSGWYGVHRCAFRPSQLPTDADCYGFTGCDLYLPISDERRVAIDTAADANAAILETAIVPRQWHLAVRDLRDLPTVE